MIRPMTAAAALLLSAPVLAQTVDDQSEIAADMAQIEQRAEDIAEVLRGNRAADGVFSDRFFTSVSPEQLTALTAQLESQVGSLIGVESVTPGDRPGAARVSYRFEQAIASGSMIVSQDAPYLVDGLLLNQVEPISDTSVPVEEQAAALPGTANLLLTSLDGTDEVFAHNADTPLALGSTFKLYVLSTLVQQIAAGERAWDDTVALSVRSFPSGALQDWPEGSPVTLHTLATMMISISDNTATDQLIAVLGRDAIEAEMMAAGNALPDRSAPFMTTRELFLLKAADDSGIDTYLDLDRAGRLAVLEALIGRDVSLTHLQNTFSGNPQRIDVEWYASPRDIASLFGRIAGDPVALDILAINQALPEDATQGWDYVGYKGGSEPGVLNMSWLLQNADGAFYALTLGWNNPDEPVGAAQLLGLAQAALAAHRAD